MTRPSAPSSPTRGSACFAEGAHRLAGAMTTAVDTLVAIAEDETVSPSVRVGAAGRLLENAVRVRGREPELEVELHPGLDLRSLTNEQLARLRAGCAPGSAWGPSAVELLSVTPRRML